MNLTDVLRWKFGTESQWINDDGTLILGDGACQPPSDIAEWIKSYQSELQPFKTSARRLTAKERTQAFTWLEEKQENSLFGDPDEKIKKKIDSAVMYTEAEFLAELDAM